MPFLPIKRNEMLSQGILQPDIIIVTGDAYVDHPSFGTAIISRVLEANGFSVCIVSQPKNDKDYMEFGKPRLAFFVNSGNIDSMVAHYTSAKKRRSDDAYTAGGKSGSRPDRAVIVYSKKIREIYGDIPIAIGGLEASLRRFAHYDYWDDKVRPSILIDSDADILMFGMGEKHAVEIANRLNSGESIKTMTNILGTCYKVKTEEYEWKPTAECPSFDIIKEPTESGKRQYAIATKIQQREQDSVRGKTVIQRHGKYIVVQNPPMPPLSTDELDAVYELPFMRNYHPSYDALGGVPGIEEVKFSIAHNRGCFGGCNFCSIAYHQGRQITARSHESILKEAKALTKIEGFKGYIHDVGGPTANFRFPSCKKQLEHGLCTERKCLAPKPCPNLEVDHSDYLSLLRKIRKIEKIKKVFIRSGIRFDYLLEDKNDEFFKELVRHHVSGQLKVAPEHCSASVLSAMGKPEIETYIKFKKRFYELTRSEGKEQFLVPYLMSSHPGSTIKDAIELSVFLKKEGMRPEQVQDFYPTPGTISTCMYYTGLDPLTMKPIYTAKTANEKAEQRALLQYFKPENRDIVLKALKKYGRTDLIGTGRDCLVSDNKSTRQNGSKPQTRSPLRNKKLKKSVKNKHNI